MSTSRTKIGCLAEDYPTDLTAICADWLGQQERYFYKHPLELTDEMQQRMDVAASFVALSLSRS